MQGEKNKTTVSVATKTESTDLSWGNMTSLMSGSKVDDLKKRKVYAIMSLAAKAYNVPPQGIDVLADVPYMNNLGRRYKLGEYFQDECKIVKEYVHLATPMEKYAITIARVFYKDQQIGEGIGEATQESIKLAAVKLTLNMMAETRAVNRAIWDAIAHKVYVELNNNLRRLQEENKLTVEQLMMISAAGKVSAEEMPKDAKSNRAANVNWIDQGENETEKFVAVNYKVKLYQEVLKRSKKDKMTQKEVLDYINKVLGTKTTTINGPKHAQILLAQLLQK